MSEGERVETENERKRTGGRSARVVRAVLAAALEELASSGYRALSIEAVAARAGVAKTTVYRRWPTRAELVRAAFAETTSSAAAQVPDTGSLREDLVAYCTALMKRMTSCTGRSLLRVIFTEGDDPELAELVRQFRTERRRLPRALVERAVTRREIPRHVDTSYLLDALFGVLHHRTAMLGQAIGRRELANIVDRTVAGALLAPRSSRDQD